MTKSLITLAQEFATAAHNSIEQKRKFSGEPYQVHPERVAEIVASVTDDPQVIAAAWLHDVLEDVAPYNPHYNADAILKTFGKVVLQLVLEVTDVSKAEDGNRRQRKAKDCEHLAQASPDAKTIKLADLLDNIHDVDDYDSGFAKQFRQEAILLLPCLGEGNPILFNRLQKILLGLRN